jgi:hypothetical protein
VLLDLLRIILAMWFFHVGIRSFQLAYRILPIKLQRDPVKVWLPVGAMILTEPLACFAIGVLIARTIGQ